MSATQPTGNFTSYDVVILGAGYAGLMAALRLGQKRRGLRIALVSIRDQFVERVRLQVGDGVHHASLNESSCWQGIVNGQLDVPAGGQLMSPLVVSWKFPTARWGFRFGCSWVAPSGGAGGRACRRTRRR